MAPIYKDVGNVRVHIGGLGRIGSGIALALHSAGVGHISANDPQDFEGEQLPICVFSRSSDVGRPKVHVLERFLDGRPGFTFEPIVAPNESAEILPYLAQADLIISCANDLKARLHLEQAAIRLRKTSVQACAQDGRYVLGGLISVWTPDAHCSCFGCLLPNSPSFKRGELLLPTVTSIIANITAHVAIELLAGKAKDFAARHNVLALDLGRHAIEQLCVEPRPGCRICGPKRRNK